MSAQTYLAYDYPALSVFWSMLVFFLWIMWFVLLFRVVMDIFRDDALGGGGKAAWLLCVVLLPFLGVFVYLIARGKGMGRREVEQARAQQRAFDEYVRQTARDGGSRADELARLSEMKARGDITEDEFRRAKEMVLADHAPTAPEKNEVAR
ncbi:Short C-terminal domain-containing protein [Streptomyces misionensis]|uniref:Short C-terminal domain-containing protein n=1 Tax=Streptomyces misionensis TaxID=67331 RepID=A0A1H4Q2H1_9ACTN|nr:SHOCT domain-containing protein [Streptomyces misionensis]SEC13857.1 Short C-terminal domain-containing protein [Streptomyces misionensis]